MHHRRKHHNKLIVAGKTWVSGAVLALSFLTGVLLFAQQRDPDLALDEAAAAFEQGKTDEAEQKLRPVLEKHPSNLQALLLAGAVLDAGGRYAEADGYYQRALKIAPGSAQLLNNAANHYLASGNRSRAREFYLKTVAIDPQHPNANLQLARMSVEEKQGRPALAYLHRLPESNDPGMLELRARALGLNGQCREAGELARRLDSQPGGDWRVHFSAGSIYAGCKIYDQAEAAFSRAFDADPRNFDILYNLGMAALHAGHTERAAGVFEIALNERPADVDCLYALSQTYLQRERAVEAAALLTKAEKLPPGRADVLLLLAQVSAQLEFYQDAAASYDRYLKLKPADEVARRERAFALARDGQFKGALPELDGYVRKHPRDAVGFYELAVAQAFGERGTAIQSLDRALLLSGELTQARFMRAVLKSEEGKPAAAIDDLLPLLDREPRNYHVLVRLGQAYLALNRARDAAQVLKRAVDLAPNAPSVLTTYARALEKLGDKEQAAAILGRLKQTGAPVEAPKRRAGLIDYLSLPPAEQRARYLANLRKTSEANPGDFRWRIRLGRELLADGKTAEALEVFRQVKAATPEGEVLVQCGATLLQYEQYEPAREFLERAVTAGSLLSAPLNTSLRTSLSNTRLDLATALFHTQGANAALAELDTTPEEDRKGDYYLLRAQLLDSLGKMPEAAEALNRGMQAAPTRASLYFQGASFLLKYGLRKEALALLDQASRMVPDEPELLLAQWVTLGLLSRVDDARKLLANIQARWPEWDRPYLLNGILLEMQLKSAEARQALETAIALGANTPEVYYYQALAITHLNPEDVEGAENAIARAMALTAKDPYVYLLAGKISLARKDYATAIRRLLVAIQLQPRLIPAHYALRTAYKALGDEQKSAAELEEIKRIGAENAASDKSPFSVEDFLFTVRPPS
jgi:tetratricopeptide (TPR) repeat protein